MKPTAIMVILAVVCAGCGLGPVIKIDKAARGRIVSSGVSLPASATNLFYAHQPQFADYLDTWISFSASPADCMTSAQAISGTKTNAPVFVPGTKHKQANHHPESVSQRWGLNTITNGTIFETKGLFVLVDQDRNIVYISMRAP